MTPEQPHHPQLRFTHRHETVAAAVGHAATIMEVDEITLPEPAKRSRDMAVEWLLARLNELCMTIYLDHSTAAQQSWFFVTYGCMMQPWQWTCDEAKRTETQQMMQDRPGLLSVGIAGAGAVEVLRVLGPVGDALAALSGMPVPLAEGKSATLRICFHTGDSHAMSPLLGINMSGTWKDPVAAVPRKILGDWVACSLAPPRSAESVCEKLLGGAWGRRGLMYGAMSAEEAKKEVTSRWKADARAAVLALIGMQERLEDAARIAKNLAAQQGGGKKAEACGAFDRRFFLTLFRDACAAMLVLRRFCATLSAMYQQAARKSKAIAAKKRSDRAAKCTKVADLTGDLAKELLKELLQGVKHLPVLFNRQASRADMAVFKFLAPSADPMHPLKGLSAALWARLFGSYPKDSAEYATLAANVAPLRLDWAVARACDYRLARGGWCGVPRATCFLPISLNAHIPQYTSQSAFHLPRRPMHAPTSSLHSATRLARATCVHSSS